MVCAPVRRDNPRAKAHKPYSIFHLSRRCLQICRTFTRPEINVDQVMFQILEGQQQRQYSAGLDGRGPGEGKMTKLLYTVDSRYLKV